MATGYNRRRKMKTKRIIIISTALSILLTACHTPLYIAPIEKLQGDFGAPNMDFIGFVNSPRDEKCIKMVQNFGRELEKNNIAVNKQVYSLGSTFDLENLKNIQSTTRYVSFVNILDSKIKYNDEISDNIPMVRAGWWVAILTLFTLYYVYVPLMLAGDKDECQQRITFNGELCIYDTYQHQLVNVIPIDVNYMQIYKGQHDNKHTNCRVLEASERNILTNALLDNYAQAHAFVQQLIEEEEAKYQQELRKKELQNNKTPKNKKRKK